MEQHSFTTRRHEFQPLTPTAYELAHVILGALEVLNLLPKGLEFHLGKLEHMMARCAAVITCTQDFGKLFQGKTELQSSLRKLDALNGRCREHPITAIGPL
jgi:hypothetical protein